MAFRTHWVEVADYRAAWHVASTVRAGPSVRLAEAGEPVVEAGLLEGAPRYGGHDPVIA
ncbi:hypothetical protein SAMN05421810_101906 [Amycolatopsis arida]|uniref:Uncharacterized protein n=1 Tax=Amycolatopsis arida TaxID=587909 RepID=A0A1I5MFM6_9PSEU|nr:hypothetical protein [Amycolatopsis arida]TDX94080.1 hypothetical protein CLV69_104538 [Amycolatopsis arida]SFP08438.1 hypothetical protein SAMN05421810_101906 [Amycolatopsis arida]